MNTESYFLYGYMPLQTHCGWNLVSALTSAITDLGGCVPDHHVFRVVLKLPRNTVVDSLSIDLYRHQTHTYITQ
jgi:hypothetical protein